MEASNGKIRADVAHDKLVAMGYVGSERTTRRAVAAGAAAWLAGHRRVHRPWVPEPGLWFQWDFGAGPAGRRAATWLFCAWLAWSRFRVVLPIRDKTLPTVIACLDATLRRFGGLPDLRVDRQREDRHRRARRPDRDPQPGHGRRGGHYGADGGDVPAGGRPVQGRLGSDGAGRQGRPGADRRQPAGGYADWAALEAACEAFCDEVNARPHRVTRRAPVEMLAEERHRLHRLPEHPWTAAFGETRTVVVGRWCSWRGACTRCRTGWPARRCGCAADGEEVIITHVGARRPGRGGPPPGDHAGHPRVDDAHFPPGPEGPLNRTPVPANAAEAEFLAIGDGAALWLKEAGAVGATRVRAKMADAVALAKLSGVEAVNWALGHAAVYGRFAEGDLASILAHRASPPRTAPQRRRGPQPAVRHHAWNGFGRMSGRVPTVAVDAAVPTSSTSSCSCSTTGCAPATTVTAPRSTTSSATTSTPAVTTSPGSASCSAATSSRR